VESGRFSTTAENARSIKPPMPAMVKRSAGLPATTSGEASVVRRRLMAAAIAGTNSKTVAAAPT